MKTLATIHIVLTVLAVVSYIAQVQMAAQVPHFAYADPARQVAVDRAREVGKTLRDAVFIPWLYFTVIHAVIRGGRWFYKRKSNDENAA